MRKIVFYFGIAVVFTSCFAQKNSNGKTIAGLRFIGEYDLPFKMQFNGTTVGGLSGIDYDAKEDIYYLISDDRSEYNPARFYRAKIFLHQKSIDSVQLLKVTTLLQPNGRPYPNKKQDSLHVPDPEAMRYNQKNKTLVWSSEGERIVQKNKTVLIDPSVNIIQPTGQWIDSFPLSSNMHMSTTEKGPRQNGVFEGLTFADNFQTLYVSVEEPLYEDGPRAGLNDTTGWIRIIKYDVATKLPVAQYAYQIDPVVQEPISKGLFIINGVPDILAINNHQLLVIERSFSTGRLGCNIRIYLAEFNGAENIAGVASLKQTPAKHPIQKKLLLNMDSLGRFIDNVEGVTFGPQLPNGKRSLIFVADDNFAAFEKTQFLFFEVQ